MTSGRSARASRRSPTRASRPRPASPASSATRPRQTTTPTRSAASLPDLGYCGSGANYNVTYGEITLGATYKPSIPYPVNVMVRPEIRYDTVIGGSSVHPFDVTSTSFGSAGGAGTGSSSSQFTIAVDLIVGF